MPSPSDKLVAVDLGTAKTVVVVGGVNDIGEIKIDAVGLTESTGMEGGAIVDIDATVESIKKAIDHAELVSDTKVVSCYVGISGNSISCVNSNSMVTLARQVVHEEDISRVIEAARSTARVSKDTRILHTIAHGFTLDSSSPVRDPKGMSALRLDADIQLICANEYTLRNIETCFSRLGIQIDGIVLNQLAESYEVLDESEKKQGVCLVKIGAGTTDVGIYLDGALRYYGYLPAGGDLVTEDMLSAIHTKASNAEEIKQKYACAKSDLARGDQLINIPEAGKHSTRAMQRSTLADIIEPRYTEIFHLIDQEIEKSRLKRRLYSGGIVLTGGGAKIEGAEALAVEIFRMPVRLGYSDAFQANGLSGPEYSTALGLLKYAITHNKASPKSHKTTTSILSVLNRWFK